MNNLEQSIGLILALAIEWLSITHRNSMPSRTLLFGLVILMGAGVARPAPKRVTPLDVRVPWKPIAFRSANHPSLAYELHVTNVSSKDVMLSGIDILADSMGDRTLQRLRGE